MSFLDVIWFIFVSFAFIAYLMLLFSIIGDLLRDDAVSGWVKAVWVILLIVIPLISALVYLISRGEGMVSRRDADIQRMQGAQQAYLGGNAGTSPAEQIRQAKELLESGAIDDREYEQLKAKVLR